MSNTNNAAPKLDIVALAKQLAQSPEMKAELLTALGVKVEAAFTPTWHVDDKGMVILEFSGNRFSKANPYMAGSVAVRFLGPDHRIAKEILAAVGKDVPTIVYKPNGQVTANGKAKYSPVTGTVKFQLDPPAAPKEDKSTATTASGTVVSEADKAQLAAILASLVK